MNLDEVLARITNPEDKAFLDKMIKDQNSYITKLEAQLKSATSNAQTGDKPAGVDKVTYAYLQSKMKEDIIVKAKAQVKAVIAEPMYLAVEPDWLDFLEKNMDAQHTTVDYAADAFNLVLGRCLANKDHAVNQIGKTETPNGTPNPNPSVATAGTNAQGVTDVNNIIRQTPPVMTGSDVNAQSGIPTPNPNPIKNTKNAFETLKGKLGGQANPFK